jgi:hypothetical protein
MIKLAHKNVDLSLNDQFFWAQFDAFADYGIDAAIAYFMGEEL